MSIDEYFLKRLDKMSPKYSRKSSKTNSRPEATASFPDLSLVEEEQQPLIANKEDVFDPAFHQTIQEIMANITRVIDEKLGPLSQMLQAYARQVKNRRKEPLRQRTGSLRLNTPQRWQSSGFRCLKTNYKAWPSISMI